MSETSKVIVALDGMELGRAISFASKLRDLVWGFKVNDLLDEYGVKVIEQLRDYGRVMADDKSYDIPNTIANKVARFDRAGASLITVHASGGRTMLKTAVQVTKRAKILAVTALTSYADDEVSEVYGKDRQALCYTLSMISKESGVAGIVCSHSFLPFAPKGLLLVVPGVRPFSIDDDDQEHIARPVQLKMADYIVVGRPVIAANDPIQVVKDINSVCR